MKRTLAHYNRSGPGIMRQYNHSAVQVLAGLPRAEAGPRLQPPTGDWPPPARSHRASDRHVSRVWRCVEKVTSMAISF